MNWWSYMKDVTGNDSTHKVAARMGDGTSPATVNRWKESTPDATKVVTLCRAYNVDPIEGLLQAGYLTEDEVKRPHISRISTVELLAEIARRTK